MIKFFKKLTQRKKERNNEIQVKKELTELLKHKNIIGWTEKDVSLFIVN